MRRLNFSEVQMAFVVQQAGESTAIEEDGRKARISQATFYNWRKKYGGLRLTDARIASSAFQA